MPRNVSLKQVLKRLDEDGWRYHDQTGSHKHYIHPTKKGKVTVKRNVPEFTGWLLKSMEEQAGIRF